MSFDIDLYLKSDFYKNSISSIQNIQRFENGLEGGILGIDTGIINYLGKSFSKTIKKFLNVKNCSWSSLKLATLFYIGTVLYLLARDNDTYYPKFMNVLNALEYILGNKSLIFKVLSQCISAFVKAAIPAPVFDFLTASVNKLDFSNFTSGAEAYLADEQIPSSLPIIKFFDLSTDIAESYSYISTICNFVTVLEQAAHCVNGICKRFSPGR